MSGTELLSEGIECSSEGRAETRRGPVFRHRTTLDSRKPTYLREGGATTEATRRTTRLPGAKERAILAARTAEDNRGRDVLVLETKGLVAWVDYFVLVTGSSRRQIKTIADEIEKSLEEVGDHRIGIEGQEQGDWVVLDFADILIHVFDEEKRDYYQLEHLWGDATPVEWRRNQEAWPVVAGVSVAPSAPGP